MAFEQWSRALGGVVIDLGDGRGGALTRDPNTGAVMIRIVTGADSPLRQITSGFGSAGSLGPWGPIAVGGVLLLIAASALGLVRGRRG